MKTWQYRKWIFEWCPDCGCEPKVLTSEQGDLVCDGDRARCEVCHFPAWMSADEEGAFIRWEEDQGKIDLWRGRRDACFDRVLSRMEAVK